MSTTLAATYDSSTACQICLSKNQQILAKDEVIRAKDALIAAKDDAIAQMDLALKAERELREQLQRQLKIASTGITKRASLANMKSASSQAQEEKDALTIYIRNVTESVTYEMLHKAFSVFGTIRTLNVVHSKACAFVEFATADAHEKALAATSVPVGEGYEHYVLTEKRVRKPQQSLSSFSHRPSMNKSSSFSNIHHHGAHAINTTPSAYKTKASYSKETDSTATKDEGCALITIY
ncbi:hypothetical protein BG011_000726 [Mortierella polycephala]|uniref:RRM domain-containing protein n=1 Tax=Mortierella polycephala TaxID=41804 RepID=A0A9P6TVN3_9FUNG|nr:hypothetical protein BG011_000726 [Mortierella polycephala]